MQAIRKPHIVRKAEILRFWDVNIPCQVSKHTLPFIFRYFAIYVDILFLGYSIAQFSIFSLSSDILNVISISHLQAATLHYSTHP